VSHVSTSGGQALVSLEGNGEFNGTTIASSRSDCEKKILRKE
jgi:hypothetical protein